MLEAVLLNYKKDVPAAREPEVLSTMAMIISKIEVRTFPSKLAGIIPVVVFFQDSASDEIPQIFDAVFECTLDMINKDFSEFPDHRTNFFEMLKAVTSNCFSAFLLLPPQQFKLIMDAVVWAFKHTMRNVADTGGKDRRVRSTCLDQVFFFRPSDLAHDAVARRDHG